MGKINTHIIEYAETWVPEPKRVSKEIIDWIVGVDKILMDNGCRVEAYSTGRFSYSLKGKTVCIIYINNDGNNKISMRGNHFVEPNETCTNNILDELPKYLYDYVMKGAGRPGHIVSPTFFEHNGVKSHRCKENQGWSFDLYNTAEHEILKKWIEYEVTWRATRKKRTK